MAQTEREVRHQQTEEEFQKRVEELRSSVAEQVKVFDQKSQPVRERAQVASDHSQEHRETLRRWAGLIADGSPLKEAYKKTEKALREEEKKALEEFLQSKFVRLEVSCRELERRIGESANEMVQSLQRNQGRLAQQHAILAETLRLFGEESKAIEQLDIPYVETSRKIREYDEKAPHTNPVARSGGHMSPSRGGWMTSVYRMLREGLSRLVGGGRRKPPSEASHS